MPETRAAGEIDEARLALGHALRELRKRAGLKARDLADASGMSRSYVSEVERGAITPNDDFLVRCERRLAVPEGTLRSSVGPQNDIVSTVASVLATARHLSPPPTRSHRRASGRQRAKERPEAERFEGRDRIQREIVSMLRATPEVQGEKILLIDLRGDRTSLEPRLPDWLTEGLADALQAGWSVEHLLRLDLSDVHAADDIGRIFGLLTYPGRYDVMTTDPGIPCGFDVLAVPREGVLVFGDTTAYRHGEAGNRYGDIFFQHAREIRRSARRLFTRYLHSDPIENQARYARMSWVEQQPGDCVVVSSRLSTFTRPERYWANDEGRRPRVPGWLDGKRSVIRAFESDYKVHHYREIVRRSSLECFVETGRFEDVRGGTPVDVGERVLVLDNIRRLLTDPASRYEMRFDDDSDAARTRNSWWLKDTPSGPVVFLYATGTHPGAEAAPCTMHIEVDDPSIVTHFRRQFEVSWATLRRSQTDRHAVVEWLTSAITKLTIEN